MLVAHAGCCKARKRLVIHDDESVLMFQDSVVVGLCQGWIRSLLGYGWFIYGVRPSRSQRGGVDGIQNQVLRKCVHVVVSAPKQVVEVEAQLKRLCLRRLIATK